VSGQPRAIVACLTDLLTRITSDPRIFGGKPIIRGMRISVEMILSLLAQGEEWDSILKDYPDLETEDLRACQAYAHAVIANDSLHEIQVKRMPRILIREHTGLWRPSF